MVPHWQSPKLWDLESSKVRSSVIDLHVNNIIISFNTFLVKRFPCSLFFLIPEAASSRTIRRFSYLRLAFSGSFPSSFLEAINLMLRKFRVWTGQQCGFCYSLVHVLPLWSSFSSSFQSLKNKLPSCSGIYGNKPTKQPRHSISNSSSCRLCSKTLSIH